MEPCHDCGVAPGELHKPGCDVEQCARCGMQAIGCDCVYEVNGLDMSTLEEEHPDIWSSGPTKEMCALFDASIESLGGRLPWTGLRHGALECQEYGFWHYPKGYTWIECEANHPEASEDLSRLMKTCRWDKVQRRFVKYPDSPVGILGIPSDPPVVGIIDSQGRLPFPPMKGSYAKSDTP
jgi:hypothetical protein